MTTIVGTRSPLFYKSVRGGLPAIIDTSKFSGNIFFVDSNAAGKSDTAGHGTEPDKPFATLDYAIGQCTANQGDVILVLPGHAETLAALITADIAGVRIIGLGVGNSRPALTVNAVIDGISITEADVLIENLRFVTPSAAATALVNIAAARATVRGCKFELGANIVDAVTITAAGELATIEDCEVIVSADGPDTWIKFEGVVDRPVIRRNLVIGSDGTNALDDGVIDYNNQAVTNPAVYGNLFLGADVATTVVVNNGAVVGEMMGPNTYAGSATGADNVSSQQEIIDQLSGASGIPTFPAAAIPANGVSLAEVIRQLYAALEGTAASQNGVATWPAAAAYGNNVSIAEVLAYIQDAVRQGTGTALPNDVSLYDILGGAKGHPAFPNAAVPANDVSMIEVIRDIWASLCGTAAGENGVQTWPVAAAPGNGVSLAEGLRHVVETQLGTITNTGAADATLATALGDLANDSLAARLADVGSDVDSATTDNLQGKLGTDTELADRSLYDILNGGGPAAAAAAAAPANDVSLYGALRAVYNLSVPAVATGETVIDEGDYDWTADYPALLTIVPAAGAPLADVVVHLDMAKAATGFAAGYVAQTIQFYIERRIDGTNWRRSAGVLAAALAGNAAALRDVPIEIGSVGVTEQVRITAALSAEVSGAAETEIPFALYYKGMAAPTVTPLTATA